MKERETRKKRSARIKNTVFVSLYLLWASHFWLSQQIVEFFFKILRFYRLIMSSYCVSPLFRFTLLNFSDNKSFFIEICFPHSNISLIFLAQKSVLKRLSCAKQRKTIIDLLQIDFSCLMRRLLTFFFKFVQSDVVKRISLFRLKIATNNVKQSWWNWLQDEKLNAP